jgi:hypothetical protein
MIFNMFLSVIRNCLFLKCNLDIYGFLVNELNVVFMFID